MTTQGKRTIAVIDDSADIRMLCKQALKLEGRDALIFADAPSALHFLRTNEQKPSLIFADLSMPIMSGGEFVTTIRSDPSLCHLKIIVTSGWNDLSAQARSLGANGYLAKPFGLDQFYATIEMHEADA